MPISPMRKELTAPQSFAAILPPAASILVLGSMPSLRSLAQGEYYAHPQNAFWPILARVFATQIVAQEQQQWQLGRHSSLPFARKTQLLQRSHIALWDTLACCLRTGSSDSSIREEKTNPIAQLLARQPSIQRILLNGQKSAAVFAKEIRPRLAELPPTQSLHIQTLPSTSPAYAAMPFIQKLAAWRSALIAAQAIH